MRYKPSKFQKRIGAIIKLRYCAPGDWTDRVYHGRLVAVADGMITIRTLTMGTVQLPVAGIVRAWGQRAS